MFQERTIKQFWKVVTLDPKLIKNKEEQNHLLDRFVTFTFDNIDVGQSSRANSQYNIEDLAKVIIAFIWKLKLNKVHVVGHSMGGFIGLYISLLWLLHYGRI